MDRGPIEIRIKHYINQPNTSIVSMLRGSYLKTRDKHSHKSKSIPGSLSYLFQYLITNKKINK